MEKSENSSTSSSVKEDSSVKKDGFATERVEEHYFPFSWQFTKIVVVELFEWTKKLDLKSIGERTGDVVVMTGAARGIGEFATRKLLQCGFHVVMGIRSPDAGLKIVERFRAEGVRTGEATCLPLDLASFTSVREFAKTVLDTFPKIHILICNAGIMWIPHEKTEDGFEKQFQVDYLSHFLLTILLLPRMVETSQESKFAGRIVNVSSTTHWAGSIEDMDDLETRDKTYNLYKAYCDAKLAQVTSSNYLEKKLGGKETNVHALSLHPGAIPTDLANHAVTIPQWSKKFLRTTDDGADAILCGAASPQFEKKGGIFIMNSKLKTPNAESTKEKVQKELWEKSCQLVDAHVDIF